MRSSRSMSSKLSTTTRPRPCSTASSSSSSVLALPCMTSRAGIGARLDGGEDLAAARDVEVQALLDHHPLNRRARERFRRERQIAARPAAAERVEVVARPVPQRVLGDDDGGGAELGGHVVEPAPADHQGAVAVGSGPGREQAQQIFGGRLVRIASASHADASPVGDSSVTSVPMALGRLDDVGAAVQQPAGQGGGRGVVPDQRGAVRQPAASLSRDQGRPGAVQRGLRCRDRGVLGRRAGRRAGGGAR